LFLSLSSLSSSINPYVRAPPDQRRLSLPMPFSATAPSPPSCPIMALESFEPAPPEGGGKHEGSFLSPIPDQGHHVFTFPYLVKGFGINHVFFVSFPPAVLDQPYGMNKPPVCKSLSPPCFSTLLIIFSPPKESSSV